MKTIGIAYFDCFSGISGDMVLGALVDAGADLGAIEAELRKLGLAGWSIGAKKVQRGAISATQVVVEVDGASGAKAQISSGEDMSDLKPCLPTGRQQLSSGAKARVRSGDSMSRLKARPTKRGKTAKQSEESAAGHRHEHGHEHHEQEKLSSEAEARTSSGGVTPDLKVRPPEHHHEHHHRGLSEIVKMIDAAGLKPRAAERAKKIFRRLGEAEAHVHGVDIEKVHFHEVGAVDSIIDIVGAAIGFELLGIDEFACSSMDVGGGQVKTEHGILPVPAPATVELLRGAPTHSSGIRRELVTPTGAAIATTLATRYAEIPPMKLRAVGYGAGSAELAEKPNVMRLLIGDREESEAGESWSAPVTVIETNVDDMSPQIYGYFVERALAAGALDVFSTPAQMKKNRPGLLVTLLSEAENVSRLIDLIFRETTTIGVRTYEVRRKILQREFVAVETPFGRVRMKVSHMNGSILNATPEYEDCQKIAGERGLPLKQVIAAAAFEFQKQREEKKA
ncbi:MAG TPA: nickel pincer cofactor biosynthesis protein LarC [Candidatus Limnocylindrales bacterium]|nr:nickel pincer cofactor biosynthesis protein LarC [Candidatus Limnocylindrales bacterium]